MTNETGRRKRREERRATEMKPHVPAKVKSPILEAAKAKGYGPGGPDTPGEKAKRKKKK